MFSAFGPNNDLNEEFSMILKSDLGNFEPLLIYLTGGPDVLFSAQIVRTYDPRGNIPAPHGCISRA